MAIVQDPLKPTVTAERSFVTAMDLDERNPGAIREQLGQFEPGNEAHPAAAGRRVVRG